jgi:hypothetical protein
MADESVDMGAYQSYGNVGLPQHRGGGNPIIRPAPLAVPSHGTQRRNVHSSLESLYGSLPESALYGAEFRIERIEPKWWVDENGLKTRINGIIAIERTPIPTNRFAAKYGGHSYRVTCTLEKSRDGAIPQRVDHAVAEFSIPADPNLEVFPLLGDEPQMSAYSNRRSPIIAMPGPYAQPQSDGDVVGQALNFAAQYGRGQPGIDGNVLGAFQQQSQAALEGQREFAQQQAEILRAQLEATNAELREMRHSNAQASREPSDLVRMVEAVGSLNSSVRTRASSDEIRAVEESNRSAMQVQQQTHQALIDGMRSQHADQLRGAEDRCRDARADAERERARGAEEADRRERNAKENAERELRLLKETFEIRIRESEQSRERLKEHLESQHQMLAQADKVGKDVMLSSLAERLSRAEHELKSKHMQLEEMLAKERRPLLERVAEIKELGVQLGLSDAPEPEAKPGIGERLMELAATQAGPVIAGILAAKAAAGQSPVQGPQQPQPQARPTQAQQQAQAPQQQRRLPAGPSAPRMVFQDPDGVRVSRPEPEDREVVAPPARPVMRAPPPSMPPPPPQQMVQYEQPPQAQVQQVQQEQPGFPAAVAAGESPAEPPWAGLAWTNIPDPQIAELVGTIEQAFVQNASAEQLVDVLRQQTQDVVLLVPSLAPAEKLLAGLRECAAGRDLKIVRSSKGRKFVARTWGVIEEAAAAAQAADAAKTAE